MRRGGVRDVAAAEVLEDQVAFGEIAQAGVREELLAAEKRQRSEGAACLMGTLISLSGFARRNELTAMFASGISLARISFVDALTGVANRRRFDEALEQEWQRAMRTGTPLAVLVADVDLFKAYNDTLGHMEGDRCLVAVAEVFVNAARFPEKLVARYGGEEFVILIPEADAVAALSFAEELLAACAARAIPHPASTIAPVVTISVGVASRIASPEASSLGLLLEADAALYRAKRAGRNRVAT